MLEEMQWSDPNPDDNPENGRTWPGRALEVVAWVIENGGEARYEPASYVYEYGLQRLDRAATLLVRQRDGSEAVCLPGQWVVKGEPFKLNKPYEDHGHRFEWRWIREFTVRD